MSWDFFCELFFLKKKLNKFEAIRRVCIVFFFVCEVITESCFTHAFVMFVMTGRQLKFVATLSFVNKEAA